MNAGAAPVKPVTAAVQENDAKAAEKLTRKLEKIRTISAKFKQESIGSDGRIREESGSMQIKRPGKFRWNTASPFEQEVVAIDKKIWMVDRDLHQVIIQVQDDRMSNTPAQLLSGDAKEFLKDYRIGLYQDDKQERFALTPDGNSDLFEKLDIVFRNGLLNSIELRDSLGGRRRVELSDVNFNGMISDSDFRVEIPKGYDVLDQTASTEQ
ncbi:outer membrane lipoprotein chaperone LolA [Endozoicomonas montiporae]|nr:outer membrane lipoprotein chaperone LolA [Endozoicomonas montiporae]